jgi:peptidoglycan/LPS O-acetylase OafA/YrhL
VQRFVACESHKSQPEPQGIRHAGGVASSLGALTYSKFATLAAWLGLPSDIIVGLATAFLCTTVARRSSPRLPSGAFSRFVRSISEMSYSLYLTHFPFVDLIGSALYGFHRIAPTLLGVLQLFAWLSALVSIGSAFWWLFERHTDSVRRGISGRMLGGRGERGDQIETPQLGFPSAPQADSAPNKSEIE